MVHAIGLPFRTGVQTSKNEEFQAETDYADKISRVANGAAFAIAAATCVFGCPASPVLMAASYLSVGQALRKTIATAIGHLVYPATFQSPSESQEIRAIKKLVEERFTVKKITLIKSGTAYDATLISNPKIKNVWTLHAFGNGMAKGVFMYSIAKNNFEKGTNTFLIDGPSVAKSKGRPTRYQMGAGFEAGLQYLEKKVKATHIIMHGMSLGGGMMAEAILQHDFTKGLCNRISYLAVSDRTFDTLSNVAKKLVGCAVKPIFSFSGLELDGVEAAKKLQKFQIRQVIIQHESQGDEGSDGIIPDNVSLAATLRKKNIIDHKVFLCNHMVDHNGLLLDIIEKRLNAEIKQFIEAAT